jgi:hypothetical protein
MALVICRLKQYHQINEQEEIEHLPHMLALLKCLFQTKGFEFHGRDSCILFGMELGLILSIRGIHHRAR